MTEIRPHDGLLPALRSIEIVPFERGEDDVYFALHDRLQLAPGSLAVSAVGYFVLAHLDGQHTCADIQAEFRKRVGMDLPEAEIHKLVRVLDEALLLDGDRFAQALAERRSAYLAAPARDNRNRYPNAVELRAEIEQMLAAGVAAPVVDLCGVIAPHLDYARGAPCYADAYATLAKVAPAARYVILGTNHSGMSPCVVATSRDFHTSLGLVPTDRAFISRLEGRLGQTLLGEETDHLLEHSVELQVHILQVILRDRSFAIVPVLCPDVCGPTGTAPLDGDGPDLRDFASALADEIASDGVRTIIIAGADLSHVGRHFNDPQATTPAFLEAVAASDKALLTLLEARDEDAFVARLGANDNATRICSAGCIFALLKALPGCHCRILKYHQAVDMPAETHVTCAAAVVTNGTGS